MLQLEVLKQYIENTRRLKKNNHLTLLRIIVRIFAIIKRDNILWKI